MRRFLPPLLVAVALLIDISVMPVLTTHWLVPCLSLCTVCVLGLLLGRSRGTLYGLLGGVLMDIMVGYPIGLNIVLFTLLGYVCGIAGRKFQRYLLTVLAAPFLSFVLYEGVILLYIMMAGRSFTAGECFRTLGRIVNETVICQFMYLWFNKLLRPSWSRYTAR